MVHRGRPTKMICKLSAAARIEKLEKKDPLKSGKKQESRRSSERVNGDLGWEVKKNDESFVRRGRTNTLKEKREKSMFRSALRKRKCEAKA